MPIADTDTVPPLTGAQILARIGSVPNPTPGQLVFSAQSIAELRRLTGVAAFPYMNPANPFNFLYSR